MRVQTNLNWKIKDRQARVNRIMAFLKNKAPGEYQKLLASTPGRRLGSGLGAEDTDTETESDSFWSNFGRDLLETAVAVKASTDIDRSEQRALELEIQKINAGSVAIEKQIALQRAKNISVRGGAKFIFNDLMSNPLTLAAAGLASVLGVLVFRRKRRR